MQRISSILVANRSEISIRVMRAAAEMGIRTVAVYSAEDRFALHRFKADESYLVGEGKAPVAAYLDIPDLLRVAKEASVDAIHPGYGFLSESPDFAEACTRSGFIFVGPRPEVMRTLGNKVSARNLAHSLDVPVMPATGVLPDDFEVVRVEASRIGYPLMLKASWGGGGRGMRIVAGQEALRENIDIARREALAAFGNDEVYLEKLVRRARHIEVQILGDLHGNLVHLFERDCSVQRRNQKVIERAPAPALSEKLRSDLCEAALKIASAVKYTHAGTVEFLVDTESGRFYFIEVNPRIQVEHTVTEVVTGIDIVKAQIRISEGHLIGGPHNFLPAQEDIKLNGHAVQCRVTTEDPGNGFRPDHGRMTAYRSAAGFGIRLDAGTAYPGAVISPFYDSLLVKVIAFGNSQDEAAQRMDRALREFRVRGLATNLQFLENVIAHPYFRSGECTTTFIEETPELIHFEPRRDRATKLLRFIGNIIVNGSEEMRGRRFPDATFTLPKTPVWDMVAPPPKGTRDRLIELGPEKFSRWMKGERRVLLTDTTMRDAQQSLFATRMRTVDMLAIAPYYAKMIPDLFSVECWGGATFDVSLRFLREDPWQRLHLLRTRIPNILFQMLLRASNAVGYTNYPDNVVQFFVQRAAKSGVDIFRVFDSLNWVENMRIAMDAVRESGALLEAAICYTGDVFDTFRPKYGIKYYVDLAKQLEKAGAHILGIKDMAGVCRPRAAKALITALNDEVSLPIHFHTHDTSGISAASVLAAIEAGANAVDGALDSMSGLTSQPNLGAIAAALAGSDRDPEINLENLKDISDYWEAVRTQYSPFESDLKSGTQGVYCHEMPGGQFTNLREQARALRLENRWPQIEKAYQEVNFLFGDIIKVTPTSKVVGDMALYMVSNGLTAEEVLAPEVNIDFPSSVVSLFKGEIGFPSDGFPAALSEKVLKGQKPLEGRAGRFLPAVDIESRRSELEKLIGQEVSDDDVASYLMYPKEFCEFAAHKATYGDVSVVPTRVTFYGMNIGEEVAITIDRGKTLVVRLQGKSAPDDEGYCSVFFELNGQARQIRILKEGGPGSSEQRRRVEDTNPNHVGATMAGTIASIAVQPGQRVRKGDPLISIEAMKMETMIHATKDAYIKDLYVVTGDLVATKELLIELS